MVKLEEIFRRKKLARFPSFARVEGTITPWPHTSPAEDKKIKVLATSSVMEVQLLVYDLSQGLARQLSEGLLGFQLDAIFHTSVLLDGLEYVYDGGIIAIAPGSSHLGQPMQRIPLGVTELPMEVIVEYLDSLRPIFTAEVCRPLSRLDKWSLTHPASDMTCGRITATTSPIPS